MNQFRTSFLSALAVLTKLATAVLLNKILTRYIGPVCHGVIGHLQNPISISTTFASGAIDTGATQYEAERAAGVEGQRGIWATAGTLWARITIHPLPLYGCARNGEKGLKPGLNERRNRFAAAWLRSGSSKLATGAV